VADGVGAPEGVGVDEGVGLAPPDGLTDPLGVGPDGAGEFWEPLADGLKATGGRLAFGLTAKNRGGRLKVGTRSQNGALGSSAK